MPNSLIPLSDGSFVEGAPLEPAAFNALPVEPTGPTTLPEEPSTLAMGFIGIGMLAVYGALQRWRRPSPTAYVAGSTANKKVATQQPKRDAA
jgi:hypothetical protein